MPTRRTLLVVPVALGLFVVLCAWGLVVEAGPDRAARPGERQNPGKKRVEEEDDDKPAKKAAPDKKRAEEEDDRPIKSGVSRLDEDAEKDVAPKSAAASGDLATLAKTATHPRVKALFTDLAVPHDIVTRKRFSGVTLEGGKTGAKPHVEPLPLYFANPDEIKEALTLNVLDRESGKVLRTETIGRASIVSIRYYEQLAGDEVKEFLDVKFTGYDQSNPLYLGRYDQLVAAEQALAAVLRFHQSARELGVRKGDGWDGVETTLRTQLLDVLLAQMDQLAEAKSWEPAFQLTRRIVDTFTRREDHKRIAVPFGELLRQALKDPNYAGDRLKEARARLRFLEEQFPGSDILKPIGESLRSQAEILLKRAQGLEKEGRMSEAIAVAKQAEETWPELPGLRTYRIQIDRSYQILRVGMRELPRYMSPGWACTDAEWRAVDLLFEGLVSLTADEQGVFYYRPSLAERRPTVVPRGREFKLPRHAKWSDGRSLTVADLRHTVQMMQKGQLTGRSPAWGDLFENVVAGADPSRVKVRLRQGLLDPLGAMSFKVLPMRPDPVKESFAEKPVGSGPFAYAGRRSEPGTNRLHAWFRANPHYGARDDKLGLPRIREVHVFADADPVAALKDGKVHLALDLSAEQALALQNDDRFAVPMPSPRTPNRRVWFLAVNQRHSALMSADVRIALARAIPRELLLDEHFRKGLGKNVHKALSGPYPAGSWASNPDPRLMNRVDKTSADPFDPDLARAKLKQGLTRLGQRQLTLSLKYPSGDRELKAAMEAMCEQVARAMPNVKLTPEERTPHDLRREVEETNNYDLAYYHHDFVDETLWLYPLLGPQGRGGADSYLGYTGSLVGKVQAAMTLRHFSQVKEYAHAIHRQLLESDMPLIPLWQLDPLCAYRRDVVDLPGTMDPLAVFGQVEQWRVRPQ